MFHAALNAHYGSATHRCAFCEATHRTLTPASARQASVVHEGVTEGDLLCGACAAGLTADADAIDALDAAERERDVAVAQLAPLLALHDAVVAAAALPGAGHTPAELIAALRGQGAEMARVATATKAKETTR